MVISQAHWDELIAHARDEAPNECCGYARARDGRVEEVFRAKSLRASPYGYEIDPPSMLAANELDEEGYDVVIYHSHPKSAAEPSQTDINLAHYPHWRYVIVSLAGDPRARCRRSANGWVGGETVSVERWPPRLPRLRSGARRPRRPLLRRMRDAA